MLDLPESETKAHNWHSAENPMSANDLTSLSQNFDLWKESRGRDLKEVNPFDYYCLEHILKSRGLTDEEILKGIVDGDGDSGVDAIYTFMDGEYTNEDVPPQDRVSKVEVLVFQLKDRNGQGFKHLEVDKWQGFAKDFLDLQGDVDQLQVKYGKKLRSVMLDFRSKYRKIGGQLPSFLIRFHYVSRCDGCVANSRTLVSFENVKREVLMQMSAAEVESDFINAQRLLEIIRTRPQIKKTISFDEAPMVDKDGFVGIVRLHDFFGFISDEHGQWHGRLFDANIRGWQSNTAVNKQIRATLASQGPNFWLLNNGITLLASDAQSSGGPRTVVVTNPQIVNGLQTSRAIYDHFRYRDDASEDKRSVLVRIIRSSDREVYERIVRATNDQNKMSAASLRSTDEIHGQIEELFYNNGLFYDRKKGHYKDEGKPASKIVAINDVLQSVLSIVVGRPDDARARPGDYISNNKKYDEIFKKDKYRTTLYLTCTLLSRRVDSFLINQVADRGDRVNIRFYIAYRVARLALKKIEPNRADIDKIDVPALPDRLFQRAFGEVWNAYVELDQDDNAAKGPHLLAKLKELNI